jgi:N-dimethylarginine dimethylaminohydrolase
MMAMAGEAKTVADASAGETQPLNEYGPIRRLMLCDVRTAYRSQAHLDAAWPKEEFLARPDFDAALAEYDAFAQVLDDAGVDIVPFPGDGGLGISSIYIRDSSLVARGGAILCSMCNGYRAGEPDAVGARYEALGLRVLGAITGEGLLEGGDFIWLDERTCAVANGYRTNPEGIRQLREILGPDVHVEAVPLPHDQGPGACLHLMSIISPLDRDLALVYSPLMAVPFRNWLLARGITLVEVPDEEYEPTMACNVLAVAPRKCLVIDGNPETRRRLEDAGCEVIAYKGREISLKGGGGPTCLTRPLLRG